VQACTAAGATRGPTPPTTTTPAGGPSTATTPTGTTALTGTTTTDGGTAPTSGTTTPSTGGIASTGPCLIITREQCCIPSKPAECVCGAGFCSWVKASDNPLAYGVRSATSNEALPGTVCLC